MQNLLPCIIISPDELPTAPVIEYFTAMPLAALYAAMALLKTASPVPAAAESEAIANIASKINFFKKNYLNAHPNSRSLKFNNALTELKIKINEKKKK